MNKLSAQLGVAALSTLSLLSMSPSGAQAAGLSLRGDLLDTFSSYVQSEGVAFDELALPQLDASDLYWDGVDPVEVFFIDEGAGFKNQLLFSSNDQPLQTIFSDVSGVNSTMGSADGVLALGEGRGLGTFDGPTQLSFFINSDGARNNNNHNLYGADEYTGQIVDGKEVNSDGLSHLIAYNYFDEVEQENYTIIGFEDLWGAQGTRSQEMNGFNYAVDRDFNDVVFAVKGLSQGAPPSQEVPEPSALLGLIGMTLLGSKGLKRKLAA